MRQPLQRLKQSRYNIRVIHEANANVLFNSLSKKHVVVDDKVWKLLSHISEYDVSFLAETLPSHLFVNRFIVPQDYDEEATFTRVLQKTFTRNDALALVLIPSFKCNLRCSYCIQTIKPACIMPRDVRESIVRFIKNRRNLETLKIQLYGGEPLISSEVAIGLIEDISRIDAEATRQMELSITTNGLLLNHSIVCKLAELGSSVNYQITLHDFQDAGMRRRYKGLFRLLKHWPNSRDRIILRVDLTKENFRQLEILRTWLDSQDLDESISLVFQQVYPWDDNSHNNSEHFGLYTNDEFSKVIISVYKLFTGYPIINYSTCRYYCPTVLFDNALVIDPLGNVYKCNSMATTPENAVGHICCDDEGFAKPYYTGFTCYHVKCGDCELQPLCLGGCRYRYWRGWNFEQWVCRRNYILENIRYAIQNEIPFVRESNF